MRKRRDSDGSKVCPYCKRRGTDGFVLRKNVTDKKGNPVESWKCEDRLPCEIGQLEQVLTTRHEGIRLALAQIETSREIAIEWAELLDKKRRELARRDQPVLASDQVEER